MPLAISAKAVGVDDKQSRRRQPSQHPVEFTGTPRAHVRTFKICVVQIGPFMRFRMSIKMHMPLPLYWPLITGACGDGEERYNG